VDIFDLVLADIYFLTLREKILLRNKLDSVDKLSVLSISDISKLIGRPIRSENWKADDFILSAKKSLAIMQSRQISAIRYDEKDYPSLLKEILNPPYLLFYRGNIKVLDKECIGIVGTRNVCQDSARAALEFSKDACKSGITIVSGLANGIDTWAHRGSLSENLTESTCAVLPSGIDCITPVGNKALAAQILKKNGCIISEYPPCCPAESWRYVQRNRLIAGLCRSVVVIQAPPKSGALITADFAVEYNRDLYFHSACFCPEAERISQETERKLLKSKKDANKIIKTCKSYVNDGALVIDNYTDYIEKCFQAQSMNIEKNKGQLDLFDSKSEY